MKYIIYIILSLSIASCQSYKVFDFQNEVYLSKNNGTIELNNNRYRLYELIGNGHSLIPSGFSDGIFSRIDTKILKFNSDRKISEFSGIEEIPLTVKQKITSSDSIILKIKNLSEFKSNFNNNINIKFEIDVNNQLIEEASFKIANNQIIIPYELEDYSIIGLTIEFLFNNRLIMATYSHTDFNSNFFEIELPKLKKADFKYIYLENEYLLIENDVISWNGQEYIKQNK